jgi:predicted metal-dependent hydrolase
LNQINSTLLVDGVNIHVIRKDVKNINFSIRTSDSRVRVSAPRNISNHDLYLAISARADWIRDKIRLIQARPIKVNCSYQSGDKINYLDQQYVLKLKEQSNFTKVVERDSDILEMHVLPECAEEIKEKLLYEWYRAKLKEQIPVYIEKWQPIIGKQVANWGVKRMKTRWGSCNISKKRIWINLELAKHPKACLEYVVVHEMTHLLEHSHNARFKCLLDKFMPDWRRIDKELKHVDR